MTKAPYLRWLAALNTLTFTGFQLILVTLYPFIAERSGIGLSAVIGCFSAGSFCFLFAGPYWASRGDRVGLQKVINVGLVGIFLSFLFLVLLMVLGSRFSYNVTLALLFSSRLLYGLTASSVVPSSQALQAELAEDGNQMKAMFTHSLSLNLGRAFGPLLVLLSGAKVDFLLIASLVWLAGLIGLNILAPRMKVSHVGADDSERASSGSRILASLAFSFFSIKKLLQKILWIFIVALLFTIFIETLNSSLSITLKGLLNGPAIETSRWIAQVLLVCSAIIIATQLVSRSWLALHWRQGFVFGAVFLLVGVLLYKNITSSLQLWSAIACFAVSIGLLPPSYLALLNETDTGGQRGQKAGLISVAHSLGYALGGLVTALVIKLDIISVDSFLLMLALGIALALYLAFYFAHHARRDSAPVEVTPC